jgi:hypothetical protein
MTPDLHLYLVEVDGQDGAYAYRAARVAATLRSRTTRAGRYAWLAYGQNGPAAVAAVLAGVYVASVDRWTWDRVAGYLDTHRIPTRRTG